MFQKKLLKLDLCEQLDLMKVLKDVFASFPKGFVKLFKNLLVFKRSPGTYPVLDNNNLDE